MATKLRYFNTHKEASITAPPTTPPLRGGFVFVFPIVFRPFFPKVRKQSQPYELVPILTSTIYVLSSRARIMREKHPLSTSFGILKYEIKNKNHTP